MDDVLASQVHEHIFGKPSSSSTTTGVDEEGGLNGPRRLLAENLEQQQMELTTEDREDHTFNGMRWHLSLSLSLFAPASSSRRRKVALLFRRRRRR